MNERQVSHLFHEIPDQFEITLKDGIFQAYKIIDEIYTFELHDIGNTLTEDPSVIYGGEVIFESEKVRGREFFYCQWDVYGFIDLIRNMTCSEIREVLGIPDETTTYREIDFDEIDPRTLDEMGFEPNK